MPENADASWFGHVGICAPGEDWPFWNGRPMVPLCQLNLKEMPFRPPYLEDIDAIAVFVDEEDLPDGAANGQGWLVRTYRDLDSLVPLPSPGSFSVRPFPLFARVVDDDFPCWDDVPIELPEDIADQYEVLFTNSGGLKLGGWPTLVQSEICWAPFSQHPARPEYVFQIDSTEKANWSWGDQGVAYIGRGTVLGSTDVWTLSWQCY
ncbi:MAG: DUF1963 domain-containing protein [Coriobacteriia bacterium]|nr:DUF1963 domain-containing protein [Coriobacteriia bacterium]